MNLPKKEFEKIFIDTTAMALALGWKFLTADLNTGMVSYTKDGDRINVYLTTMTVGTCINHPKKGKTQLFRKNVTKQELKKIFKNPRTHTKKGYYTK